MIGMGFSLNAKIEKRAYSNKQQANAGEQVSVQGALFNCGIEKEQYDRLTLLSLASAKMA